MILHSQGTVAAAAAGIAAGCRKAAAAANLGLHFAAFSIDDLFILTQLLFTFTLFTRSSVTSNSFRSYCGIKKM